MLEAVAACQKPDQAGLQALLAPVAAEIAAADRLTGGRRGAAFNHFKAAADALPALAWVAYAGPGSGALSGRGTRADSPGLLAVSKGKHSTRSGARVLVWRLQQGATPAQ